MVAESWDGALLGLTAVPGCVFGIGPAEVGAVKDAEDGLGVVAVTGEVSEVAPEAGGELACIAEAGDTAGTVAVDVPESKSVAELGLVVSELYCKRPSGVVVAWDSGASFGVVFESRVEFGLEAAFEADYTMAPCENTHGAQSEVLAGPTVAQPELLDKPENVEFGLVAVGTLGEWVVCAGDWPDLVALVCQTTAGMETDPWGNPAGKAEFVLYPVDAG